MIISYELDYSSTYGYSVMAIDQSGAAFCVKHLDAAEDAEKFLQEKLADLATKK